MKSDILFMFELIASAVTDGDAPVQPENIDWETIYRVSAHNSVANIVAHTIIKGDYIIPDGIKSKFMKRFYERVAVSETQNAEIKKLLEAFSQNGIYHMPMKGVVLNEMYPSLDMRFMADADVLIKQDQFDRIDALMSDLGYIKEEEGPIEYNYKKPPFTHIELHKYPIALSSEDLFEYYGDGWRFAQKTENSYKFRFSDEDHFIYIFTHFVRHYRDAGAGLKSVIDIWLYAKKYSKMNWEYIEGEIKKLNMWEFYNHLMRMSKVWFEHEPFDEIASDMTLFILNSGTFGNVKNQVSATSVRDNKNIEDAQKLRYLRFAFPPLRKMKMIFPILEKAPVLLPFLWVWRVVRFALFRRKDFNKHREIVEQVDNESVLKYDKHMKSVGLDMSNGRNNK